MRLLVDLFFVPADDALSQAVASHLGLLLDVRWDKASVRGRWRRFGGDLVELATDAAREDTMLQATSALGHRLEVGKYRLLLTLAAPAEVAVVARGLRSFVRACPVELDRGSVRAVGEAELDSCPGRFEADAIVDVATERSFDLHVDPPCAWEAIASDPLPPGVVRDVADGVGVLCWTSTFEPEACYRAFSVRSTWLRRTLGGRDAPTGAVPEAPCRPEWHPPRAQIEARLRLPTKSLENATGLVRALIAGETVRPWPGALADSAAPFAVRTGRSGAREHVLHLSPTEVRPRSLPKFTFAWTADEVVVRYGPLHESQRAEGQDRVDRLIEKATGSAETWTRSP